MVGLFGEGSRRGTCHTLRPLTAITDSSRIAQVEGIQLCLVADSLADEIDIGADRNDPAVEAHIEQLANGLSAVFAVVRECVR